MRYLCMVIALMLICGTAFGYSGHRFCVKNATFETIEICIYPYNPLYYETDTCFWVGRGTECIERKIYFEDVCDYDICAYGSVSKSEYGCVANSSCASIAYIFSDNSYPYICDNFYCDEDTHWVIEPSASISCFVSAADF